MLINKQTNKHHLKNFNPEMFLSKEQTGIKNGSVAEGRTMWRSPPPPISILSADTKPHTVAGAKRHLLSGTWYDCSYGGSTTIVLSSGTLLGELMEGLEEWRGIATL